jgi:hypothetical protein
MIHELNLQTLMEGLDNGRVGTAFQQQLRRVIADCQDRPGDDKERRVILEFKCVPICDDDGGLDEVKGKFHVTSTVPKLRSKSYSFGVRKSQKGPMLIFNDLSDDNIHQKTIDEE